MSIQEYGCCGAHTCDPITWDSPLGEEKEIGPTRA